MTTFHDAILYSSAFCLRPPASIAHRLMFVEENLRQCPEGTPGKARLAAHAETLAQAHAEEIRELLCLAWADRFPALHKWAHEVLNGAQTGRSAARGDHAPLTIAAAWEAIAAACEHVGEWEPASRARAMAERALSGVRAHPTGEDPDDLERLRHERTSNAREIQRLESMRREAFG